MLKLNRIYAKSVWKTSLKNIKFVFNPDRDKIPFFSRYIEILKFKSDHCIAAVTAVYCQLVVGHPVFFLKTFLFCKNAVF